MATENADTIRGPGYGSYPTDTVHDTAIQIESNARQNKETERITTRYDLTREGVVSYRIFYKGGVGGIRRDPARQQEDEMRNLRNMRNLEGRMGQTLKI